MGFGALGLRIFRALRHWSFGVWGLGLSEGLGLRVLRLQDRGLAGLLSNQGEKSINLFFHNGSSKEKSIKVWYSKAS